MYVSCLVPQVCKAQGKHLYNEKEGARAIISGLRREVEAVIKGAIMDDSMAMEGGSVSIYAVRDPAEVFDLHFGPVDAYDYDPAAA